MGYVLKKSGLKKRSWKIYYQDRRKDAEKPEWYVPENQWRELGILPDMDEASVKARIKQLNAQSELKRRAEKRQKIDEKLKEKNLSFVAYLGDSNIREFEDSVLFRRKSDPKLKSHWTAAQECICALKLPIEDWEFKKERFYDYFSEKQFSISYVQKLLPVINKWGMFQARKYRTPFMPIPAPRGKEKYAIDDAYFEKNKEGRAPAPLTLAMLEKQRSRFPEPHYNWLLLSIAFGLRVEEVNGIAQGKNYEIKTKDDGSQILAIYQTKLTSVARAERWKFIPVIYDEQKTALALIGKAPIKAPLTKTVTDAFGPRVGLRSGRKNFTDMMLDRGETLEDISAWLGHKSIARTWNNYRDRQKARHTKKAA